MWVWPLLRNYNKFKAFNFNSWDLNLYIKKKHLQTEIKNKKCIQRNSYNDSLHLYHDLFVLKSFSHTLYYLPVELALSPDGYFKTIDASSHLSKSAPRLDTQAPKQIHMLFVGSQTELWNLFLGEEFVDRHHPLLFVSCTCYAHRGSDCLYFLFDGRHLVLVKQIKAGLVKRPN